MINLKEFYLCLIRRIMAINECKIIELPRFLDSRGNLSFVEQTKHIPFEIKRLYWIYDIPGGEYRGGHAFKETNEFIIALSGGFDVIVDDGLEKRTFTLNRSYYGLYIPNGFWREITNPLLVTPRGTIKRMAKVGILECLTMQQT